MAKKSTRKKSTATAETKSLREVATAFVESVGKDVGPSDTFAKFKAEHPDLNGNTESSVKAAINNARKTLGFSKPHGGGGKKTKRVAKPGKRAGRAVALMGVVLDGKPSLSEVANAIAVLTAAGLVVE